MRFSWKETGLTVVQKRKQVCIWVLTEARLWHMADPCLACGGSLFYNPRGSLRGDSWCVVGGMSPRRLLKPLGPSSVQVKRRAQVVCASENSLFLLLCEAWYQQPERQMCFTPSNILPTFSVYTGRLCWVTSRRTFPFFYILSFASFHAKFWEIANLTDEGESYNLVSAFKRSLWD